METPESTALEVITRLFIIVSCLVACHSIADATVFTFNDKGQMVADEAVDYTRLPVDKPLKTATPKIKELIETIADEFSNVDRFLLDALVAQESAYNVKAVSSAGAQGLTQLMPATAARLNVTDVFDPEQNLRGGATELSRLLKKYPSMSLALAAYNAGEGAVKKYEGIPPYTETQDYVVRVMERMIKRQEKFLQLRDGSKG